MITRKEVAVDVGWINGASSPALTTPEQFREFIRAKSAKFARIIQDAGITLEQ